MKSVIGWHNILTIALLDDVMFKLWWLSLSFLSLLFLLKNTNVISLKRSECWYKFAHNWGCLQRDDKIFTVVPRPWIQTVNIAVESKYNAWQTRARADCQSLGHVKAYLMTWCLSPVCWPGNPLCKVNKLMYQTMHLQNYLKPNQRHTQTTRVAWWYSVIF